MACACCFIYLTYEKPFPVCCFFCEKPLKGGLFRSVLFFCEEGRAVARGSRELHTCNRMPGSYCFALCAFQVRSSDTRYRRHYRLSREKESHKKLSIHSFSGKCDIRERYC